MNRGKRQCLVILPFVIYAVSFQLLNIQFQIEY